MTEPATDEFIEAMKGDMQREGSCTCPNDCIGYSCQDVKELIARIEALSKENKRLTGPNSVWFMYITLRAEVQKLNKAIARKNGRIESLKDRAAMAKVGR